MLPPFTKEHPSPMRAIVGVDAQGTYKPALCLLASLGFPEPHVNLVFAADPTMPFQPPYGADAASQAEYTKVVQNIALLALEQASQDCCGRQLNSLQRLVFGAPANMLISEAENTKAELVAVCATHSGQWSNSFLGSVSRALTISSPTTVLVAKGDIPATGPLKAVLATDHSAYADRCVDKLIQLAPKGITDITVACAYDIDDHESELLHRNLAMLGGMVDQFIEDTNIEKTQKVVDKLKGAGYNAMSRVVRGNPNDVIRDAMQEAGANILVLGAQGHGFVERLMVGSVSLNQVISEPYSVLVLRA